MSPESNSDFRERWVERSIDALTSKIETLSSEQHKTREAIARIDERMTTRAGAAGGIVGSIIAGIVTGIGLLFHNK
jgi:hypothetical protein